MSEIKNVGLTWMALNTYHLMPLHFKGFTQKPVCTTAMGGSVPAMERVEVPRSRPDLDTIQASLDSRHLHQQLVSNVFSTVG